MKRKKKKIPLRKLIRRLERKADKALSLYVREITRKKYNLCPLCKSNPIQCLFHFISRKRKIIRWSIKNVIGACKNCNLIEQFLPDWSRYWYLKTYGVEVYLSLVEEARKDFTPTVEFLEGIIKIYTNKLEEVKNGTTTQS